MSYKPDSFQERASRSAEAKKKALDKLKARTQPQPSKPKDDRPED